MINLFIDTFNCSVYSIPISNREEGERSRQCYDRGKVINARGLWKNGKIIQLGSIDEGASWCPIRIVARDDNKWKANPPINEVDEDWILYVVEGKPLECLEWDPTEYKWKGEQDKTKISSSTRHAWGESYTCIVISAPTNGPM